MNPLKSLMAIFPFQVADDRMALVANSQMDLELGLNSTKAARLPPEWYVTQLTILFYTAYFQTCTHLEPLNVQYMN